ncbi:MAG: phosphoenolpyruvate synthase [Chloroflexi bacterium]|nr:phosphoenolpyruvate synthase [Chloroflexota bacterium]
MSKSILWFQEVDKTHVALVGGKGANLGEMLRAGIPVPPGFIVTADSYYSFLVSSGLDREINGLLGSLDPNDNNRLQQVSEHIKEQMSAAPMPPAIAAEIRQAYKDLGNGPVAVRSSATAEDLPEASFAGQQSTFLNVQGDDNVVAAVQGCWASLFQARAIFYRVQQGFDHGVVKIAVPVQRMVQSQAAGVMFTVEPTYGNRARLLIEAVYGLGEAIVSGEVKPDIYFVHKGKDGTVRLLKTEVSPQEWQLVRNEQATDHESSNIRVPVPADKREAAKLTEEQVLALARIGLQVESHYGQPQDIEWAMEGGGLYIVQSRPITTLGKASAKFRIDLTDGEKPILTGSPASPGAGAGLVKIVLDPSELGKVEKGDVLVAEMTSPDYVPAMVRASAIVTDRGGRTCHAAIVSRELGVPCVVGTEQATSVLREGAEVSVDGSRGHIYPGLKVRPEEAKVSPAAGLKTKTRVYVNLAVPELAEAVSAQNCDGVGLLRAEFIIANHIGVHPRYMIDHGRGQEWADKLAQGLEDFAWNFYPRPVVYRFTDFKTNEYRGLKGGDAYEGEEENPMLGYRGCSRYIAERDVFQLEIDAIRSARQRFENLWVMAPFVRTVKEMADIKAILDEEGLRSSDKFKVWMMVEVPSNIILLDKFIDTGIDGISIGSNDLTQLTLGVDRDNQRLARLFDERDEAVMLSLEKAIVGCKRRGITASICGQAPSVYPELTRKLVEWGITSVSVAPDMIDTTREIVARIEGLLQ